MTENLRSYLQHTPECGQRVMIDPSAVIIGQAIIGDDVSIWPQVTIRADDNSIHIGARTNIQDNCVLHVSPATPEDPHGAPLIIGQDVTIGHGAILHGCKIGNCVLIGMGSIVLDNTVIEDNVILGVGSVVPSGKHLISGYLYFGSPARQVRALTKDEITHLTQSAIHYMELKDRYLE